MNKRALIVFGKNPVPGRVKTRLASEIGSSAAARLYQGFLIDTVERFNHAGADVRLYIAPTSDPLPGALSAFDRFALRQRGAGLGERMKNAFADTFMAGYDRVVIVGSDHPTLPLERIHEAFERLAERSTIVIGPSEDGGYYLLGLGHPAPQLFDGITYSRGDVFERTVDRAKRLRRSVHTLASWYDVDSMDDLGRLVADLNDDESVCPHTRLALAEAALIENAS